MSSKKRVLDKQYCIVGPVLLQFQIVTKPQYFQRAIFFAFPIHSKANTYQRGGNLGAVALAKMLEAAGVALIQASVGMGEEPNLDPRNVPTPATMLSPRGNLIDFAARIKNAAKIPVTAGGGITPEMREKVLLFCSWPESDAFGTITEKMISGKVLQLGKKGGITEGAKDSPRWVATKNLAKVGSWVIIATESFAGKFAQMVCISQLFRVSNFPRTY